MGHGERETISLAVQLGIEWVLIDDGRAMKKAKQQGLRILQFFDILLAGKTRNLLSSVRASLDAMKAEGEGIESELYSEILQQAKE